LGMQYVHTQNFKFGTLAFGTDAPVNKAAYCGAHMPNCWHAAEHCVPIDH
jgi:hypothetical protein